jgi:hypothetical protein
MDGGSLVIGRSPDLADLGGDRGLVVTSLAAEVTLRGVMDRRLLTTMTS